MYYPTNNIISDSDWVKQEMTIPNLSGNAAFAMGEIYYVELTVQLNPTKSGRFAGFGISTYNLPASL
jgi:hypothetical protein